MFFIFLLFHIAAATPLSPQQVGDRCFIGGSLIKEINQSTGLGEVCIKDDISIIKSINVQKRISDTKVQNIVKFYKTYIAREWHDCNPIFDEHGSFMVFDISNTGSIIPKMHTCRAQCEITLNKDNAEVIFTSAKTNHYEVSGTTTVNGWFKQTISVSLEHTCEHVVATCGQKSLKFHACFRQHRSCVRFFRNSYLPYKMIESLCINIELIIILCYALICFIFAYIITKTYIAYLLIPLFYPITYIYGKIYNKYFKRCKSCLLAVHPLTNCNKTCVCGCRFNSTEALKVHRLGKDCNGFKALSKARFLCKSTGPSFTICFLTGMLILSFITPINSEKLYKLEDLPDDYINLENKLAECTGNKYITRIIVAVCIFANIFFILLFKIINDKLIKNIYRTCNLCNMVHPRKNLKIYSEFTNKCGTCVCGFNEEIRSGFDYEIFIKDMHIFRENCLYNFYTKYSKIYIYIIIIIINIQLGMTLAEKEEPNCLNLPIEAKPIDMINCYGLNLNITENKKKEELIEELKKQNIITDHDIPDFDIIDMKTESAFEKIETAENIHRMAFLEYILYTMEARLNTIKGNSGPYNVAWKAHIKYHNLDVCGKFPHKTICTCINAHLSCSLPKADDENEIKTFYTNHQSAFKSDVSILIDTISIAFRGIIKVSINILLKENKIDDLRQLLINISNKLETNIQMKRILLFTAEQLKLQENTVKTMQLLRMAIVVKPLETTSGDRFNNFSSTTKNITECKRAKALNCHVTRRNSINKYLLCDIEGYKIFSWPDKPTLSKNNNICLGDSHCNLFFKPLHNDDVIKTTNCYKENFTPNPMDMESPVRKCEAKEIGDCTVGDNSLWPIIQCNNEKYYYADGKNHAKEGDINSYCLSEKCNTDRLPIHTDWLKSCKWINTIKESISVKEFVHLDIESYKKGIESDIRTDLIIHKFRPVKNLPHIAPKYKSVTISGVLVADGIQNAFVSGEMPAISGLGIGYNLYSPDGTKLFDIVLFLRKAIYKSTYRLIYKTGPTIGINVEHNEQCTGSCPKNIPKQDGWLTFSKEHTSQWGCEEFGCLAIDTGCLYGSCQDIIRPEIAVFKMLGEEMTSIEICLTTPKETYCNDLDLLEPLIGDKIEVSFQTVQSNHMPKIIAVKNNKVYTGQINDQGNTANICGSVQIINKTIIGQGNPKFDYLCHAMKRKDVIVRKCFDNHFETCKMLEERNEILINQQSDTVTASMSGKNLGIMNFKFALGDIDYKTFTEDASFDIKGQCVGCINCIEEIVCELNIISTSSILCPIKTPCENYHNSLEINPATDKYHVKMSCPHNMDKMKISICSKDLEMPLTLKQHDQKIDLSKLDESNYIKEEDLRCNTWLCKVKEEGIGFLFSGIFGNLGKYWTIFIIIFSIILAALFCIFIAYPCCKRLKGFLEINDVAYLAEQKMK
ncbi:membrane glycoprotein polyprotein [Utive virus]|uniref:Envelopment polyprotein n=1 Tax=Utive virus TaxID=1494668 RepID=A0A023W0R5_9VIRU|nr:membrane glycoprotein polyprotein [Utive virus]